MRTQGRYCATSCSLRVPRTRGVTIGDLRHTIHDVGSSAVRYACADETFACVADVNAGARTSFVRVIILLRRAAKARRDCLPDR